MSITYEIPAQLTMMNLITKMKSTRPTRPPAIPPTIPPTSVAELGCGDEVLLACDEDADKGMVTCTVVDVIGGKLAYTVC
jgi:hypothetical protein